jgi:hypothetical protein
MVIFDVSLYIPNLNASRHNQTKKTDVPPVKEPAAASKVPQLPI